MGLQLSRITLRFTPLERPQRLDGATAAYDEARENSRQALDALVEHATVTKEIMMLLGS